MESSIGDRVFYTRSTGLPVHDYTVFLYTTYIFHFRYPRRWLAFCTMGMWSWSMIKVVCKPLMPHGLPSPLASPVSSLHHHPHQFPQLTSLRKFLWTPLLMEAPFAAAPQHDYHHIPQPEASLGNGAGD